MSRYFAPITKQELKAKIEKAFFIEEQGESYFHPQLLREKLDRDLKIRFDNENFEDGQQPSLLPADSLVGYHTLKNGLTFCGMSSGGDWEYPVFFIVYWDGKKLRGYVPTEGNPWNTTTKRAYGNDEAADLKNARKRWPEAFANYIEEDMDSGCFDFDFKAIKQDILERIQPQKANGLKKETLQERIEACIFYSPGDEAYELFQEACRFAYMLSGLGFDKEAAQVVGWTEDMARASKEDAQTYGGLEDKCRGVWGYN